MSNRRRILASRKFELVDESSSQVLEAEVIIYCPDVLPDQGGFRCEYQIKGLGSRPIKEGKGDDALQAVILTLAKIGIDLYKSPEAQAGRLRWRGELNLGIPVFDVMTDFVPGPKDTLVM